MPGGSFVLNLALYGLGTASLLHAYMAFSPMTRDMVAFLSRDAQIDIFRHRHKYWAFGILCLGLLMGRLFVLNFSRLRPVCARRYRRFPTYVNRRVRRSKCDGNRTIRCDSPVFPIIIAGVRLGSIARLRPRAALFGALAPLRVNLRDAAVRSRE